MLLYCLKCRKNTESKNPLMAMVNKGKLILLWKCAVFDCKKLGFRIKTRSKQIAK